MSNSKHQKSQIPASALPQHPNKSSTNTNGPPKVQKGFMKAITGPYVVHVAVPAILSLHVCSKKSNYIAYIYFKYIPLNLPFLFFSIFTILFFP
jgi:hypothetical protein